MSLNKQDTFMKNVKRKEIDLKEYFEVIKRRIWLILAVTVLTSILGLIYNDFFKKDVPLYRASRQILIDADNESLKTLTVMIKAPMTIAKVKNEIGLKRSADVLNNQIGFTRIDESKVFEITVVDPNPQMAIEIANETAIASKNQMADFLKFNKVQLIPEGEDNGTLINGPQHNIIKYTVVIGIVLGIGIAFLLDSLDETVRRESEIEEILDAPVIGLVSNMNKKKLLRERKKYKTTISKGETNDF
ncbi:hypothetical protein CN692_09365 [Bacillus sp. AFS002410]|uniref:YveK family protein n=1 Tax=Bacillus sp. AFS002410 TaxID=2033481 RepID=UPI000BEF977C|nr:Wzz/FepE/Etk N-terminal domain-containing protein [Bacillus sp. AFS002410]PEJ58469.1 hypothetical protein CN692_09365 [Bacillus sp. AFS002410]